MPPTPPNALKARKTPRQARSEATVNAIFEATIQVLITHGARQMTTTRVAERAGVSVGTMYQYFPHKQALLYAVIARYLEVVAQVVEACCREQAGQPLAVASDALVLAYIQAKGQQADAARALYLASAELEVAELVTAAFQRFHAATARLLASVPDAHFPDLDRVAFTVLASLTGATRVVFEQGATPEMLLDFSGRMKDLCRTFLQGASSV
jgi:AcrR family transcriptional regulator